MAKSPKTENDTVDEAIDTEVETVEVEAAEVEVSLLEEDVATSDVDDLIDHIEETGDVEVLDEETPDEPIEDASDFEEQSVDTETGESEISAEESTPESAKAPASDTRKTGGFFPLLIGGLVAGGIGYGVAHYMQPEDQTATLTALIETQSERIKELQSQIDNIPAPDLTGLETQISEGLGVMTEPSCCSRHKVVCC